eukprot:g69708.t1
MRFEFPSCARGVDRSPNLDFMHRHVPLLTLATDSMFRVHSYIYQLRSLFVASQGAKSKNKFDKPCTHDQSSCKYDDLQYRGRFEHNCVGCLTQFQNLRRHEGGRECRGDGRETREMYGNCASFMSKPRTRSSKSVKLDTQPAPKKHCKREEREGQESKRIGNAWLLAIPIDLWCCIRGYIGWMKLVPLARVCKRLAALVKDPELWKGLAEPVLDLSKFKNSEPLVAWSKVLRESKVSFHKVLMAEETTDSVLKQLNGIGVQQLNLALCRKVTDAGLAHLSALPLQNLDLTRCVQVTDAGLAHLSALPLQHLDLSWCRQVTDAGLAHLSALPLQHLNLNQCRQVTDAGLAHLSALPLQHLNLVGKSRTRDWLTCLRYPSNTSISVYAGKSRTRGWLTCLRCPSNTSVSLIAGKSRTLGWLTCLFFLLNIEYLRAGAMDAGLAYLSALAV